MEDHQPIWVARLSLMVFLLGWVQTGLRGSAILRETPTLAGVFSSCFRGPPFDCGVQFFFFWKNRTQKLASAQ